MEIFDLSLEQTNYILEMPLRRLTKFSRIELEAERDDLLATITSLEEVLASDEVLKSTLDSELAEVADSFGTPRRTVLLDSAGPAVQSHDLEIPDEQCQVLVSVTRMAARDRLARRAPRRVQTRGPRRPLSIVAATTRGQVAVITSDAQILPPGGGGSAALPDTADSPSLKATVAVKDFPILHLIHPSWGSSTSAAPSPWSPLWVR